MFAHYPAIRVLLCAYSLLFAACINAGASIPSKADDTRASALFALLSDLPEKRNDALQSLADDWHNHLTPALVEFISLEGDGFFTFSAIEVLQKNTGQNFGFDLNGWYEWAWQQDFKQPAYYADFKAQLYRRIDEKFAGYFSSQRETVIRLDEVRWGGVLQDGIPPLREPRMVAAKAADYLDDSDVVFGLAVNGDLRAYPKRIMAWHEMFVDSVGEVPVVGAYCTLCGAMIVYESTFGGVNHALGTSGFLYRSNKLMYDRETQSLWNTLWGEPVIGPLAGKGIRLKRLPVVTSTWGEWRRRHPQTKVLALDTGFRRDYREGAAYQEYFATDELMFNTPKLDRRLRNKAEVLGLLLAGARDQPLAIAVDFLRENPLYHDRVGKLNFVVLSDDSGAVRVYASEDIKFSRWDGKQTVHDSNNEAWSLSEDKLTNTDGRELNRLPSHNAFWFGWYSAFSHTRLVH